MPALYSHTTRATGTVLTASIYNGDHQNHIDNGVPLQLDDYSVSVTQMKTSTDPGESGTESLATTLAGELERLRFALKEIKTAIGLTSAEWYSTATGTIALTSGGTGASTASGARDALGAVSGVWPLSVGGVGATTASGARDTLGATAGVFPISAGGTGQSTQTAAMDALSPTTTKGDLLVDNGTNVVRLAVGSDNQVLTADAAQSSGLKWGSAGGIAAVTAKTATFNVTNADNSTIFLCNGTFSVTFDALSSFASNFYVYILNDGTGTITLDPNGTEEIEIAGGADAGETTITLPYSGTTIGPYNVSGVMLIKSTVASTWRAIAISEAHGSQTFTANGTFNVPKGVNTIWVTGVAGGGGGGGSSTAGTEIGGSGGGSSGVGTVKQRITVTPAASHTVTIGTGGSAGSSAGGNGGTGGTTSLGALVSLTGGNGGTGNTGSTTGTVIAGGASAGAYSSAGENGFSIADSGTILFADSGNGGSGLCGGSGRGGATSSGTSAGGAAPANSGGGGGGGASKGANSAAGGAGGSGLLIVEW